LCTVLVPRRSAEQSMPLIRVKGKTSGKSPSRQAREQKTAPPKTHARARSRLLNKKISTPKNVHAPGTCLKQLQRTRSLPRIFIRHSRQASSAPSSGQPGLPQRLQALAPAGGRVLGGRGRHASPDGHVQHSQSEHIFSQAPPLRCP